MAPPAEAQTAPAKANPVWRAAIVASLLLAAGLLLRFGLQLDLHRLHPNAAGAATFVAAGAVLTASGLPRQVAAFAGGYVFGPWSGMALSLAAQMLGCWLDYEAASGLFSAWASRRLAGFARVAAAHRSLTLHPFSATLTLRLLPVSNNVALNLLAGTASLPRLPFLAATLIGYLPQTAIFALLGSGAQIGRAAQIVSAAALLAASALVGWLLTRRAAPHA